MKSLVQSFFFEVLIYTRTIRRTQESLGNLSPSLPLSLSLSLSPSRSLMQREIGSAHDCTPVTLRSPPLPYTAALPISRTIRRTQESLGNLSPSLPLSLSLSLSPSRSLMQR